MNDEGRSQRPIIETIETQKPGFFNRLFRRKDVKVRITFAEPILLVSGYGSHRIALNPADGTVASL